MKDAWSKESNQTIYTLKSLYEMFVTCYLLYRSNQGDTYPSRCGGGVDHRHYHDHQGEYGAFRHDRDRQWRDLSSYGCDVIWLATENIWKIQNESH